MRVKKIIFSTYGEAKMLCGLFRITQAYNHDKYCTLEMYYEDIELRCTIDKVFDEITFTIDDVEGDKVISLLSKIKDVFGGIYKISADLFICLVCSEMSNRILWEFYNRNISRIRSPLVKKYFIRQYDRKLCGIAFNVENIDYSDFIGIVDKYKTIEKDFFIDMAGDLI